jgi:hypothetical protein
MQHEMNNGRVGAGMIFTALYWFTRYAMGYGAGAERAVGLCRLIQVDP